MSGLALQFVCLLLALEESVVSLPFSESDIDLRAAPVEVWKRDSITDTDRDRLLQENDSSLRAVICPGWDWDPDAKCTDSHGIFLSIG